MTTEISIPSFPGVPSISFRLLGRLPVDEQGFPLLRYTEGTITTIEGERANIFFLDESVPGSEVKIFQFSLVLTSFEWKFYARMVPGGATRYSLQVVRSWEEPLVIIQDATIVSPIFATLFARGVKHSMGA